MDSPLAGKSTALLRFLKDAATIRRKRIPVYGASDKLLWVDDIPADRPECLSAFFANKPNEMPDLWLELHKKREPRRPSLPDLVKDWVRPDDLDLTDAEPQLLTEITVLVPMIVSDPDAEPQQGRVITQEVPEVRRLVDYPQVENTWFEYFVNRWEPWAKEKRRWQEVQRIYEDIDFMRRRLEESEERYELILGVGFLGWSDSSGTIVKRHLLTAPAEITLDAVRGVLTVRPGASFEKFRVELDMLELQNQPRLDGTDLDDRLEELDVRAWDPAAVGKILRIIANRASPDSQVDESAGKPPERTDGVFRVAYAPAIILRERRPAAYEEVVTRLLKAAEGAPSPATTPPWRRFLSEGASSVDFADGSPDDNGGRPLSDEADLRLYFPLSTNEEQRRIAERLRAQPFVLVKGPPGTGKSHTIANLICHLLATGDRVLVTAHAPKALAVLRELLPASIRNLCVTTFGSTHDDQKLLEDSVRAILARRGEWKGEKWASERVAGLERDLRQLEGTASQVERSLRESREAETHSHVLPGGYEGTAGQIARQVEAQQSEYGWFPEISGSDQLSWLQPVDVALIADVHNRLTQGLSDELDLHLGTFVLATPEEFEAAVANVAAAERALELASRGFSQELLDTLRPFTEESLTACSAFLRKLEEQIARASGVLGDLTESMIKDLLVGQQVRWDRLAHEAEAAVDRIDSARQLSGRVQIEISSSVGRDQYQQLMADVRRRLEHFAKGGRRGLGILAPRVVRETQYIEESCRVDGEVPRGSPYLEKLAAFLELKAGVEEFSRIWPVPIHLDHPDPRQAAAHAADLGRELGELLRLFEHAPTGVLHIVPIAERVRLAESNERMRWLNLITTELARRAADRARGPIGSWRALLSQFLASSNAHGCLRQLSEAVEAQDSQKWRQAWEIRERLVAERARLHRYRELLAKLDQACPGLRAPISSSQGDPEWKYRLLRLKDAWAWAAAKAWLRKVADVAAFRRLVEERHRLQDRIERKLEELATTRAWRAFFGRIDDSTEQDLIAWQKAISRIGKDKGKYAYRHRRAARQYLVSCIPKIPGWIMPLHKLWETIDPTPGVFDTVIVDEASQAGIEALALLLLAKRIIVVGDDKQNSPEAVGVLEDDIARLARDNLREFRFRDEFRPDTSLFDHAERAFGNLISLREHFRCVPEIIRFSNSLCYSDAPLIPLRQPPPNRLAPPLQPIFVEKGHCEGEGQRIINRAEADRVVNTIAACVADEAYEGKTMGVMVLQGHAQAELIEKKLAERLEPRVREERKLRCGVPATFQGDQRDVIFLSLVVASNHNYRALAGLSDQRRFNVAMSRAKDQVWVFHSVQQHELSREDLRLRLLKFFYEPNQEIREQLHEKLDRLEQEAKRSPRRLGEQLDPYGSWFEVDVALELLRREYRVRPQYEVAGYHIDLVVEGFESRLAVECDGDTWHGPEQYDQDLFRQRQLERSGWMFVRIRESEFYADRDSAVRRILEVCEGIGIRPIGKEDAIYAESAAAPPALDDEHLSSSDEQAERREMDEEVPEQAESTLAPAVGPFAGYSADCGFPDPRDASSANIQIALRQIIEQEGPLTKSSVYRLYVEGCPSLRRAGKTVRSILNRVLWVMQKAGDIAVEDELGDRSLESQVLRLAGTPKVRERPAGRRDLFEVPPSELLLTLDHIRSSSTDLVQDDGLLARALLERYGFTRLTEGRRRHLARILSIHHQQHQRFKPDC